MSDSASVTGEALHQFELVAYLVVQYHNRCLYQRQGLFLFASQTQLQVQKNKKTYVSTMMLHTGRHIYSSSPNQQLTGLVCL